MPFPTPAQLGAALRHLREARDASMEGVAAEVGIDTTWLGRIERGAGNPSWSVVGRIADVLEVDAVELVRLAGTMPAAG